MPSLDRRGCDKIADTLAGWGWRVVAKSSRPGVYLIHPPDSPPFSIGPDNGGPAAIALAQLRRAGVEFDPKRRTVARHAPERPTPAPTPRPPAWLDAPSLRAAADPMRRPAAPPLDADEVPGWVTALRFSEHAGLRMATRVIAPWEVHAAIARPEYTTRDGRRVTYTRGDVIAVVEDDAMVVTVIDRFESLRDAPRSPAQAPAPMVAAEDPKGIPMSTSAKIRDYARTLAGDFSVGAIVAALDDPLASSSLVSTILANMLDGGEVERVARGMYRLTRQPAQPVKIEKLERSTVDTPPPAKVAPRPPRPRTEADTLVVEFEWATIDPPARVSPKQRDVAQLAEALTDHLDALKNNPGRWAVLATFAPGLSAPTYQDRARSLRAAFPGVATRVVGRTLYVSWTGQ